MATTARAAASRATGGQVQVQTTTPQITPMSPQGHPVLRLRGARREGEEVEGEGTSTVTRSRRRIQWAADVIDNEGLGRKKSKVCCIYHPQRPIDESSDESSSDDDDTDSDGGDDGSARPAKKDGHSHEHGHNHNHDHGRGRGRGKPRSPNAYEKVPKIKNGG